MPDNKVTEGTEMLTINIQWLMFYLAALRHVFCQGCFFFFFLPTASLAIPVLCQQGAHLHSDLDKASGITPLQCTFPLASVRVSLCAAMWNHCATYYRCPFSPLNTLGGIPVETVALLPAHEMGFVTVLLSSNPRRHIHQLPIRL